MNSEGDIRRRGTEGFRGERQWILMKSGTDTDVVCMRVNMFQDTGKGSERRTEERRGRQRKELLGKGELYYCVTVLAT